ncbi:MAG: hypothetical protein GY867_01575 [bacterium]|nr:hypothetical protein [bacterium]
MKFIRIGLAVVITLAMLYVARSNSKGQPEIIRCSESGVTFDMISVPKALEHTTARISLTVAGLPDSGVTLNFRHTEGKGLAEGDYEATPMQRGRAGDGEVRYSIDVDAGDKGGKLHYYFDLTDSTGATLTTFEQEDGSPFLFKYIGEVPSIVLLTHIIFIFAAVFCVAMATVHSFPLITGGTDTRPLAVFMFWAMITCFLGGYPFGIPMNYYAFDCFWEGVPFGHDATDNKTQLLFVYLLFAALTAIGSFTRGKFGRDLFSPRGLGWIGLSTFAAMLFIYLIPHSIQFSPEFTYAFCYTWIGLVALAYVYSLTRFRRSAARG